tara:strand:- start:112 stop:219 length:108 start_codon:yes stop_codon:yes gene_type:complete
MTKYTIGVYKAYKNSGNVHFDRKETKKVGNITLSK